MKKQKIFWLSFLLCFFTACSSNESNEKNDDDVSVIIDTSIAETDIFSEETTTTGSTTTELTSVSTETTIAEPMVTTAETTTEIISESIWEQRFYVDDFNRETDDPYLTAIAYGTFSNSATTNSELVVRFIIERYNSDDGICDWAAIKLYEYGSINVKNSYSKGKYYDIQILEENENIIKESGYMNSNGGDRISIWGDKDQNTLINALKNNSVLTIRIDEEDGMDSYIFEVDCIGFGELFDLTDWAI